MIKAEINKNRMNVQCWGDIATVLTELYNLVEDILTEVGNIAGESKQQLLLLLTQNILKEWSGKENENE